LPQGLGSGLSLHRSRIRFRFFRCCPSSLYTFPAGTLDRSGQGLARDRNVTGFPKFEQFYTAGFPGEHSSFRLSPFASADFATPARFPR
jgi:hypothetical protein